MTTVQTTQQTIHEQGPATAAMSNQAHDVIQLLSEKLDSVWRYDKYIEDCSMDSVCADLFRQMKEDDIQHVNALREQIERLCREGQFR